MIYSQTKRYQITLWLTQDRSGPGPALRVDFENEEEARTEFDKYKGKSPYRSGILLEFHQLSQEWNLLDQFS